MGGDREKKEKKKKKKKERDRKKRHFARASTKRVSSYFFERAPSPCKRVFEVSFHVH